MLDLILLKTAMDVERFSVLFLPLLFFLLFYLMDKFFFYAAI